MYLGEVIKGVLDLLKIPFTLGSFTFSLWQVYLFMLVAGIISYFVWRFFDG